MGLFDKTAKGKRQKKGKAAAGAGSGTAPLIMALEPRFMFDAAAVATAGAVADRHHETSLPHHQTDTGDHAQDGHAGILDALGRNALLARSDFHHHTDGGSQVAFVDPDIADSQQIIAGIKPGVQVVVLDPQKDGVGQITSYLQSHSGISAIYVFSHGSAGDLHIGTTSLTTDTISAYGADLSAWRSSLKPGADILLYGCDVAEGTAGHALVDRIAALTGADVAASVDPTGAAAKGGNWTLEYATGKIEHKNPLTDKAIAGYDALMDVPGITVPTISVSEDGTVAITGLSATYAPGGGSTMSASIQLVTGSGTLTDGFTTGTQFGTTGTLAQVNSFLNSLHFTGATDWNGAAKITVTVTGNFNDSAHTTSSADINFNVTAVNNAPERTAPTAALAAIYENQVTSPSNPAVLNPGDTVADLFSSTFTDARDAVPGGSSANLFAGVVVVGNTADSGTQGSWQYSLNGGTSWQAIGTVATNSGLYLSTAASLRFVPAANFNGAPTGLTVRLADDSTNTVASGTTGIDVSIDGTNAGGTTRYSSSGNAVTLGTSVTAVDQPPVISYPVSVTASKDTQYSFGGAITVADVDAGSGSMQTTLTVANGTLQLTAGSGIAGITGGNSGSVTITGTLTDTNLALATLKYTANLGYTGSDTLTVHANDNGNTGLGGPKTDQQTVSITVASINLPPVVTVPGTLSATEDLPSTLSGIVIADPDSGGAVEQATFSSNHGNITFSSYAGVTVTGGLNGSHSVTVQGTLSNLNAAIAAGDFSYLPDLHYHSSDTITVQADDLGNTGGTAQIVSNSFSVNVAAVPHAPVTGSATLAAVAENTLSPAGASVASLLTNYSDLDGNALAGVAISADASSGAQGTWQYLLNGGTSWQAVGAVSTGSALMLDSSALLRFTPATYFSGTPGSLTLNAIDNSATNGTRVFTSSGGGVKTTNVGSGYKDIDASGAALSTGVTFVAQPLVLVNDFALKMNEAGTATIGSDVLDITDVDASAAQIVYTIQASGTNLSEGQLKLSGSVLSAGSTFTQDDINNGRLVYAHSGVVPSGTQTVAYTVTDGLLAPASRTLQIIVYPVNNPPVLYLPGDTAPGNVLLAADVQKGSSLTFTTSQIVVTDLDNTAQQEVFRVESLPTHGLLTYNGNAVGIGTVFNYAGLSGLKYINDGTVNSSDSFTVSLRDGAGGVVGVPTPRTVNISIVTQNAAPTGIGNLTSTIYENPATNNGVAIQSLSGYGFADTDPGAYAKGIAVVANNANAVTQGSWQYSTDGTHWAAIGSVNDSGSALVLAPSTLVRFVPVTNYSGAPTPLSIRALDNTYFGSVSVSNGAETRATLDTSANGGSTPIAAVANTLGINITPVDVDPVLVNNGTVDVTAQGGLTTITTAMLQCTDVDSPTITYRLESRPSYGWITLNGQALGVGAIFTQADIDAGNVKYQSYYSATTDGFSVTVRDGGYNILLNRAGGVYNGSTIEQVLVPISIGASGSAPGGTGSTGGGGNGFVAGGGTGGTGGSGGDGYATGTNSISGGGAGTPVVANADQLYTSMSAPVTVSPSVLLANDTGVGSMSITAVNAIPVGDHGTVTVNGDGTITFTPEVNYVGDATFRYQFTDSSQTSNWATVTVHVLANNDPVTVNVALDLNEGAVATITSANLQAASSYTYTLGTTLPTNGLLYYDTGGTSTTISGSAVLLSNHATFTQADIDAGYIKFQHDGSEHFYSAFNFTLTNGSGSDTASVFNIEAIPVNHTPTVTTTGTAIMSDVGQTYVFNSGGNAAIVLTDVDGTGDKTGSGAPPGGAYQSSNTQLGFRVTSLPTHGTLKDNGVAVGLGDFVTKADLLAGNFEYVQNGTSYFHDSFQITPDDGQGVVAAGQVSIGAPVTVALSVVPSSLDPVLVVDTGFLVANGKQMTQGNVKTITIADLTGTDPDNTDAEIQFRITSDVTGGELTLNGKVLGVGSAFSQQDLDDGRVQYYYNAVNATLGGDGLYHDAFSFKLSDGGGGNEPAGTFNIELVPLNHAPVLTVPGGLTATEDQSLAVTGISFVDPDSLTAGSSFGTMMATVSAVHGTATFGATTGLTFVNGTANGEGTVEVTGTLADLNAALATLNYRGNSYYNGSDTLTVRIDDLGNYGDANGDHLVTIGTAAAPGVDNLYAQQAIALTVTAVNDPPTLTGISSTGYTQNAAAVVLASGATPYDVDLAPYLSGAGNWGGASITLSRSGGASAEDHFTNSGTLGALTEGSSFTLGGVVEGTVTTDSNGRLTLTFADGVSTADVKTVLSDIAYTNSRTSLGAGETANVTLNWVLDDGDTDPDRPNNGQGVGGHLFVTVGQTVTLTGVNDAPVRSGSASIAPALLTVTEDVTSGVTGDTVADLFHASYSDPDTSNSLAGVAITANASDATQGHWQYSTDGGGSWNAIVNDGSITSANALVLAATDKIRFIPDALNYNGTPGALTVRMMDNSAPVSSGSFVDVSDDTAKSGGTTQFANSGNAVALEATVTPVNDAPTLSIANTSFNASEGSAADLSSAGFTVYDVEAFRNEGYGANKGMVSVTLSNADGTIAVADFAGASIVGSGTGSVTVTGSLTSVNGALNAAHGLSYTPGDNPLTSETIAVDLNDLGNNGTGTTLPALHAYGSIGLSVTQRNDAPTVIGSSPTITVNEDAGTGNQVTLGAIDYTVGNATDHATVSVTIGSHAAINVDLGATSTLTGGTASDSALAAIKSAIDLAGYTGVGTTIGGGAGSETLTITDTVVGEGIATRLDAGHTAANTGSMTVTDYSSAVRTIYDTNTTGNGNTGANSAMVNSPNSGSYAAPGGVPIYTLFNPNFADVDTNGPYHTLSGIAITANASNSAQGHWEYSTNGGTSWSLIPTALSTSNALVIATGAGDVNDLIRFLPDAANFNGTPGALTVHLSDGSGFTASSDNSHLIDISGVLGGSNGWSTAGVSLGAGVTAVNDPPVINNLSGQENTFVQAVGVNLAGAAILIDPGQRSSLTDVELTGQGASFDGATLTVQNHGAVDHNDFYVVQSGVGGISISGQFTQPGSGLMLFNSGSIIQYNGTPVATITDNCAASGQLLITFKDAASGAAVDAILQNLAYSNKLSSLTLSNKTIDVTFDDGNGISTSVQGLGGHLSDTEQVTIHLVPANIAPSLTLGDTINGTEDASAAYPGTPSTLYTLLGGGTSNFVDPNGISSLAGVALGGFADKSTDATIRGSWQVSFNSGSTWTNLSTLSTSVGGISAGNALLLSASTMVQFVPDAYANTAGLATPPRLVVFGVEDSIPNGASTVNAPAISFSTAANALLTYNTTTDTLESRVSATSVNIDVLIAPVNDAPTLSGTTWTGTLYESPVVGIGTPQQQLITSAAVSDLDLSTTHSLDSTIFGAGSITVGIASGAPGDKFSLPGSLPAGVASVSGGLDGANFVITLSGTATISQVQTILQTIVFENTSDTPPSGTTRAYTVTLNDGNNVQAGGNAGGPAGLDAATVLTGQVTIIGANDPPTVYLDGMANGIYDYATTFTEGNNTASIPVNIAIGSATVLSDPDNTNLTRMVLTVGGVKNGNSEVLTLDGVQFQLATDQTVTNTTSHFDIAYVGGVFTITKDASAVGSLASFQTLLQGITYDTFAVHPTAGNRTVTVLVTDAGSTDAGDSSKLDSNTATATVTVVPVNNNPTFSSAPAAASYTERLTPAVVDAGFTVSDRDDLNMDHASVTISTGFTAGDTLSVDTSGTVITASYDSASHTLTLTGLDSKADYSQVLQSLAFSSTSHDPTATNSVRTLTYSVTDGNSDNLGLGAATSTTTRTVNVIPVNDPPTLTATGTSPNFQEAPGLNTQAGAVTLFSGASIGTIETGQNIIGLTFTVSGLVNGASEKLSVDGTSITLGGSSSGTTATNGMTYNVSSIVGGTATVTLTKGAGVSTAFMQTLVDGITYQNTNRDDPTGGNRVFTITGVQDSGGTSNNGIDTTTLSVVSTVDVIPVNDPPTLTATASNPSFQEAPGLGTQAAAVSVFSGASVGTVETGQSILGLTFTVSGLHDSANEVITVDGTSITLDANSSGTTGTNSMAYSVTIAGGTATVALTKGGGVSTAAVQTLVNGITYQNTNLDDPTGGNRVFTITQVQDSGGTANGGIDTTALSVASTVDVKPVNDPPTLTATGLSSTFQEAPGLGTQAAAVSVFSGASISTIEANQTIVGLTFTVSGLHDGVNEKLNVDGTSITLGGDSSNTTATNGMTYSVTVVGGTATVALTKAGGVSTSLVQSLVNGITYQNTNLDDPTGGNRVFTIIQVKDSGGTANGGSDTTTLSVVSTIGVVPVNDPPTLTATGSNPTFQEAAGLGTQAAAVSVFSGASIGTVEANQTIVGLTFTVSGLANGANEKISVDGTSITLGGDSSATTATNGMTYSVTVAGGTATVALTKGGAFPPRSCRRW